MPGLTKSGKWFPAFSFVLSGMIYSTALSGTISIATAQTNLPPFVDAGVDQTITLADSAFLVAAVSDDGLPDTPGAITAFWSQLSGPGTVTFGNRNESLTTAIFSATGTYVLRLTVSDGELNKSDDVEITVNAAPQNTIRITQDFSTIQAGIDAAQNGDLVLVSPGTYVENLLLNKTITLASTFYTTGDASIINQTVISSPISTSETIYVDNGTGPETKIVGFTITNGKDVKIWGHASFLHNHVVDMAKDAFDYESGSAGLVQNNVMENNGDDGVDIDDFATVLIQGNLMQFNQGDGVEIRANNIIAPTRVVIIRDNTIQANSDDGIQLIDDDETIVETAALLVIDRNLIANNNQAGFGLMDNRETTEDYRAASLLERIHLFNNTFVGNLYGVTGGDNLFAINNIFLSHPMTAVKQIDGAPMVSSNLFWNNGIDNDGSNLDPGMTVFMDPLLDANHQLQPGDRCRYPPIYACERRNRLVPGPRRVLGCCT